MPNHVSNDLNVTGPKDDLLAFHAAINLDNNNDDYGIIRAFLPFPAELEGDEILNKDGESVGRAFSDEGYNWCLKNWGTKWGDYETYVTTEPHEITPGNWGVSYAYNTAWSPANAAIITIAKQFPTLSFDVSWEEEGHQSCGALAASGDRHANTYFSWDQLPDYPENWDDDDEREQFFDEFSRLKELAHQQACERLRALVRA